MSRKWLWVATILNAIVFLPAAIMAANAYAIASRTGFEPYASGVAFLFIALPALCIAVPVAAWRSLARGRYTGHIALLLAMPLVYAGFLVYFLFSV